MLTGCGSSLIRVIPSDEFRYESAQIETGKNYTISPNDRLLLFYQTDAVSIIRSNTLYKPELDISSKNYPDIARGSRFEIIGRTEDNNYVGFPIDGYKRSKSSDLLSDVASLALTAGSIYAGVNARGLTGSASVNSALVRSRGDLYSVGLNKSQRNTGIAAEELKHVQSADIYDDILKSRNSEDVLFFFDGSTLKPYAFSRYIKRKDADNPKKYSSHKILDSNGDFRIDKEYFNLIKKDLHYLGLQNNIVSLRFNTYLNYPDIPTYTETITIDLNNQKQLTFDGYTFDIIKSSRDAIELAFITAPATKATDPLCTKEENPIYKCRKYRFPPIKHM
jgi:hypothetical protein